MQDKLYDDLAKFLDAVERHGTEIHSSVAASNLQHAQTVSDEARVFKKALLRLRERER